MSPEFLYNIIQKGQKIGFGGFVVNFAGSFGEDCGFLLL